MTWTETAIVAGALALAISAARGAETCKPPNVARTLISPPAPHVTLEHHPPVLHCPAEGSCFMAPAFVPPPPPTQIVICLTPEENAAAESRQ